MFFDYVSPPFIGEADWNTVSRSCSHVHKNQPVRKAKTLPTPINPQEYSLQCGNLPPQAWLWPLRYTIPGVLFLIWTRRPSTGYYPRFASAFWVI